ncbi:hypothetical protein FQZ97_1095360 [compost metagenome]
MPATPKCAAERRIAPKLCGLPTPSSHSAATGLPSGSVRSQSDIGIGSTFNTSATTPSWCVLAARRSRSPSSTTR